MHKADTNAEADAAARAEPAREGPGDTIETLLIDSRCGSYIQPGLEPRVRSFVSAGIPAQCLHCFKSAFLRSSQGDPSVHGLARWRPGESPCVRVTLGFHRNFDCCNCVQPQASPSVLTSNSSAACALVERIEVRTSVPLVHGRLATRVAYTKSYWVAAQRTTGPQATAAPASSSSSPPPPSSGSPPPVMVVDLSADEAPRPSAPAAPEEYGTWLHSPAEACAWADQQAGVSGPPDRELKAIRNLEFTVTLPQRRLAARLVAAVAACVLSESSLRELDDPADAALRVWALPVQQEAELGLFGGSDVRPSVLCLGAEGTGGGSSLAGSQDASCGLLGLLSAPPAFRHPTARLARERQLRRLAALLKRRSGKTDPWQLPEKHLPTKLLDLAAAAAPVATDPLGPHQTGGRTTASAGRKPPVGGGGQTKPLERADAVLRALGLEATQVLQALAQDDLGDNTGMCARCGGESGLVAHCATCVDCFCAGCLGLPDTVRLPNGWVCRYCEAVLPAAVLSQHASPAITYLADVADLAHRVHAWVSQQPPPTEATASAPSLASANTASSNAASIAQADAHTLPAPIVARLRSLPVRYLVMEESAPLLAMQPPRFWCNVVAVLGWALRELAERGEDDFLYGDIAGASGRAGSGLGRGQGGAHPDMGPLRAADCEMLLLILSQTSAVLDAGKGCGVPPALRDRLARALLSSGTLQCCSRVLECRVRAMGEDKSTSWLMRQILMMSSILSLCRDLALGLCNSASQTASTNNDIATSAGTAATGSNTTTGHGTPGTSGVPAGAKDDLFCQLVRGMHGSGLLEHAARTYLKLQSAVQASTAAEGPRMDTGTAASAWVLLGAARKPLHSLLVALWTEVDERVPWSAACPRPLAPVRTGPSRDVAAALLPQLRELLSGPCLQYLLGRGLVAAAAYLAGRGRAAAAGYHTSGGATAAAADNGPGAFEHGYGMTTEQAEVSAREIAISPDTGVVLLTRLPEAAGVWHLTVSGPLPPAVAQWPNDWLPAEAMAPSNVAWSTAGMPYKAVNVYDMVYDTVMALTRHGQDLPEEVAIFGLPLLLRLVLELRSRHAVQRLPGLWRLVCRALVRAPGHVDQMATDLLVRQTGMLLSYEASPAGRLQPERQGKEQGGGDERGSGAGHEGGSTEQISTSGLGSDAQPGAEAQPGGDVGPGSGGELVDGVKPESRASPSGETGLPGADVARMCDGGPGGSSPGASGSGEERPAASDEAHGDAAPAAAGAGTGTATSCCCTFGLRCALDGGIIPTVEQMLRQLWERDEGGTECVLSLVNLLRYSGVWPAVLAHGSLREVASLAVTVRKVPPRPDAACAAPRERSRDGRMERGLVFDVYALALLEQVEAAVLDRKRVTAQSGGAGPQVDCVCATSSSGAGSSAEAYGSSGSGGVGAARTCEGASAGGSVVSDTDVTWPPATDTPSPTSTGAGRDRTCEAAAGSATQGPGAHDGAPSPSHAGQLSLNDHLASTCHSGVHLDWVLRACGRLDPDSPAARQQRLLAVFCLVQWLPGMVETLPRYMSTNVAPESQMVLMRLIMHAALQCLAATSRGDTAREAAWRAFLVGDGGCVLGGWLTKMLGAAAGEGMTSAAGSASRASLLDVLEPVVFDLLEALVVALPGHTALEAIWGHRWRFMLENAVWPAAQRPAGPNHVRALAAPHAQGQEEHKAQALWRGFERKLLSGARQVLLAVIRAWSWQAGDAGDRTPQGRTDGSSSRTSDGTGDKGEPLGSAGSSAEAVDREVDKALAALRSEVQAKHDLDNLPLLPSPAEVVEAVAAAGVRACAHPACANLEGPSEAELLGGRPCSRCKAVWYCCGACQLAHWREGHQAHCSGVVGGVRARF